MNEHLQKMSLFPPSILISFAFMALGIQSEIILYVALCKFAPSESGLTALQKVFILFILVVLNRWEKPLKNLSIMEVKFQGCWLVLSIWG